MSDIYAFPLSQKDIIRAETRHEAIDRMADEAKAEIRRLVDNAYGWLGRMVESSPDALLADVRALRAMAMDETSSYERAEAARSMGAQTGYLLGGLAGYGSFPKGLWMSR